jgi:hypothetical protein
MKMRYASTPKICWIIFGQWFKTKLRLKLKGFLKEYLKNIKDDLRKMVCHFVTRIDYLNRRLPSRRRI